MDKTRKHALKQNDVIHVASQQLSLHEIVLAIARHCENKKSFVCVDVCMGPILQQNVGAIAGKDGLLRRIVGSNVWLTLLLRRIATCDWQPVKPDSLLQGERNRQNAGNY